MTTNYEIQGMTPEEKIERIAALLDKTPDEVSDVIYADWPNAAEHEEWWLTAPVQEIADWIASLR